MLPKRTIIGGKVQVTGTWLPPVAAGAADEDTSQNISVNAILDQKKTQADNKMKLQILNPGAQSAAKKETSWSHVNRTREIALAASVQKFNYIFNPRDLLAWLFGLKVKELNV